MTGNGHIGTFVWVSTKNACPIRKLSVTVLFLMVTLVKISAKGIADGTVPEVFPGKRPKLVHLYGQLPKILVQNLSCK